MRFHRLFLTAFGPFTDRSIDLHGGFQLLIGPNEAGKSSLLRALTGFLFGIPTRTGDAHVHEMKSLRVGAVVGNASSDPVALTRRKGNKSTLLDEHGEPVPDQTLTRLLGGMERDLFENVFALNHERLRHGGLELVAGGGDLAESLFGAGLGRSVAEVLRRLEQEADETFKPRASIPPLNKALKGFLEARKATRALVLKPGDWREKKLRLAELESQAEALKREGGRLAEEARTLDRQARLIPLLAQHAAKKKDRADLGEVVVLPPDATTRRTEAQRVLTEAGPKLERLDKDVSDLEKEAGALVVPEELLALETEIGVLRDKLGAHRKAMSDRDGQRRPNLKAHMKRAADALRQLGRAPDDDQIDTAAARGLLVEAARERLIGLLISESRKLDEARRLLTERRGQLAARRERTLEKADRERDALGQPSPPDETLNRHERLLAEIDKERDKCAVEEARLGEALARIKRELSTLAGQDAPPTEEELLASRAERERVWERVRGNWLEGDDSEPAGPLAGEFEGTVGTADAVVDRMRGDADRVARRAGLLSDADSTEAEQARLASRMAEVEERAAALSEEWRALWDSLGFDPLPPREMRSWIRSVRELESKVSEIDDQLAQATAELDLNSAARATWSEAWKKEMAALGLPENAAPEQAETVLETLEALEAALTGVSEEEGRIAAIDRDAKRFGEHVARVTGACAGDLSGAPVETAVPELERRLREGTLHRERREGLNLLLRTKSESRRDIEERRDLAKSTLAELVSAARVATPEELPEREAASEQARALDADIDSLSGRIGDLAPGVDPAELAAELAEIDELTLPDRIRGVKDDREESARKLSEVEQEVGGLRGEMDRLDGTSASADAAAEAEEHLAEIRRHAENWAVLRLGAHVLGNEVERYRREHQGPLLERTAAIFTRLTLGSFTGLEVDLDDRQLLCVRAAGQRVRGEGLSEGTADQLYLALRVAAVEQHVAANTPVPFVADDIFVNFDDARARAGLEVLGELAEQTQVLFFTHHSRLRELAEEALGERCRVHELG